MTLDFKKRITYELALEYCKQHQVFSGTQTSVENAINEFSDVCEKVNEALDKSSKIQKLF